MTELNNNGAQTVYATKTLITILWVCIAVLLFVGSVEKAHSHHGGATGVQRHIVLRVDFADSGTALPRYSRVQVEQLLGNVTDLFSNISNNNVQTVFVVTEVFRLPGNKADYGSGQSNKTITDAIANAPANVQALWANNVHAVLVLLSQKGDAGGSYYATRNVGLNGSALFVGNAVIGENPSDTDLAVWGRWAHEVGHNMQVGYLNGLAVGGHPSGYQSDFDLMDSNYPGRTGPVSLQEEGQFRHWLSSTKYQTFTPALGGGNAAIWAIEYDQNVRPNMQAVKVEITSKLYYMVSVRRRVRGDELNANFQTPPVGQRGIPDEGVMIERVDEVTNPQNVVTVIGRNKGPTCSTPPDNCNRQQLWMAGDTFRSPTEVTIEVTKKVDDDNYLIRVLYNDIGLQPDVMINPWLSPPGNTWETTDIWVDSPVNGFGVFRYGMHDDGTGNMVPVGNGDDAAVGQTNRVYARIRNVGKAPASNVVATIEVTDPLGMGITNTTQWALVGKANSVGFPQLASIPVGGFVDVFVDWKPTFMLTPAQVTAGVFYFHSCLRVRIDAVAGETVLANQDGDREQENISYFQVAPKKDPKPHHMRSVLLHNDDLRRAKDIILGYRLTVPKKGAEDWQVRLNKGVHEVTLAPGERREVPVEVVPGPSANIPGQRYSVDVFGLTHHVLVNDLDEKDRHNEFRYTGGARIEALVVVSTRVSCRASVNAKGLISVVGQIHFGGRVENPGSGLPIMAVGSGSKGGFIESSRVLMIPKGDGQFRGSIKGSRRGAIERVDCMFAGTTEVSSASHTTPVVRVKDAY